MRAPAKLGAYAAVLALALGGGLALGAAVGPLDDGDDTEATHHPAAEVVDGDGGGVEGDGTSGEPHGVGGPHDEGEVGHVRN